VSQQPERIDDILQEGQLAICAGPGGVGKTTTAAAMAVRAALSGRKAIVLTIDPARRLANSLGLEALTNSPSEIDLEALLADEAPETAAAPTGGFDDDGELWAMMLDQEQTFEDLVDEHAPDQGAVERSKSNTIYQFMSRALHGMQEYAALDKLHDLYTDGYFDIIILDTPPTANALEFLEAPDRMVKFFDDRIMKWFLPESSRESSGFFSGWFNPGSVVLNLLAKLVGQSFVDDLVEFFDTFQYLQEALQNRGEMIEYILREPDTHFVLVTSADPRRIKEVLHFRDTLQQLDQSPDSFVVNRVIPNFQTADLESVDDDDLRGVLGDRGQLTGDELSTLGEETSLSEFREHYQSLALLARRDRESVRELAAVADNAGVRLIPVLGEDVHSLADLRELGRFLDPSFGEDALDLDL
jgi:anion-transporting  ArsA/GET3 family ATPase